jgi:phage tail sheath protein FI
MAIIDPPSNLTSRQVSDWANGNSSWNLTAKFDTSFAAIYYPWLRIVNPATESPELVPPSVIIPTMYTYTDNVAASWYAPAGVNRGRLTRALSLENRFTLEDRDLMYGYPNVVNPIISIPGQGIVVWGQKTCQRIPTALDRVNVRRLMNYISKVMSTAFMSLLFEPNDHISRAKYVQIVQPILDEIQANRGLYSCSVVCDASLNPASVVEQNEMRAKIYLQPMKTVEVIDTTYILTGTGATVAN